MRNTSTDGSMQFTPQAIAAGLNQNPTHGFHVGQTVYVCWARHPRAADMRLKPESMRSRQGTVEFIIHPGEKHTPAMVEYYDGDASAQRRMLNHPSSVPKLFILRDGKRAIVIPLNAGNLRCVSPRPFN